MGKSMLKQAEQYFLDIQRKHKNIPLLRYLVVKDSYSKPVIHILPVQNHIPVNPVNFVQHIHQLGLNKYYDYPWIS